MFPECASTTAPVVSNRGSALDTVTLRVDADATPSCEVNAALIGALKCAAMNVAVTTSSAVAFIASTCA